MPACLPACPTTHAHHRLAAGTGTAAVDPLVPGDNGRMRLRASTKPVILVLGSGWGAHSFIKVGAL